MSSITGGKEGSSREQIYNELGLNWSVKKCSHKNLVFFYKRINRLLTDSILCYLDFSSQENYLLRSSSASNIIPVPTSAKSFKRRFFPYCINEWNKLKVEIRNTKSIYNFKKSVISEKNSLFSIYDLLVVKLLTRLRLQFNHLN